MADFDEIVKLSKDELVKKLLSFDAEKRKKVLLRFQPEERINLIRMLEEERKKEEKESDQIVRESIEQMERNKLAEEIPLPESEEINIERLFGESELEQQVREEEPPEIPEEQRNTEYGRAAENRGIEYAAGIYDEITGIAKNGETGYDNISKAAELRDRLDELGKYESQNQAVKQMAEASSRIVKELFGEYQAKRDYVPGR